MFAKSFVAVSPQHPVDLFDFGEMSYGVPCQRFRTVFISCASVDAEYFDLYYCLLRDKYR
ncbi:uncharacterized protein PHALS_04481 [Plasmopara halstedii]|uniref:Uncharacterized protein n=1 Tax=Plasmopara halstedii TaxID=4781 RepID=A0A0P1A9Q0_PLAHL|nr:uncharacterized protein PHALS_04481 [Plasmopara halstedii]CEG37016.1 hypothetical protein PHALS_04481 [Plasmopara halstedii]|eukprot:XP_024573385.1 hypothetical protein PHALS_04481 [Plasmopara halstedii]